MGRGLHLGVPFAVLLPAIQLLLALLVITPELMVGFEFQYRAHTITLDGKVVPGNLDMHQLVEIATHQPRRRFPDRLHAMSIVNVPGILGEVATSLPTTWPESWYPESVYFADLWAWRALSWAVYALPLWWMAGRALDVLMVRNLAVQPRIHSVEMSIMMVLGVVALVIGLISVFTGKGREEYAELDRWFIVPGLMWFVFGACSVLAWRRQRNDLKVPCLAAEMG
jgi:hypothetical protein